MQNRYLLLGSIVLVAVVGLALAALAASSYSIFSGGASQTTSTVTEIGKLTTTSTMQWPIRKVPENLTEPVYKTSVFSRGLNLTMEYNATSLRFGEVIVIRLTLENVNYTGSVGIHEDLIPWAIWISNSSGIIDGRSGESSDRPIVTLRPSDKINTIAMWDNTVISVDPKTNQLIIEPTVAPGTYQMTGEVTLLDPEDGHKIFTIETQPVTIEAQPS